MLQPLPGDSAGRGEALPDPGSAPDPRRLRGRRLGRRLLPRGDPVEPLERPRRSAAALHEAAAPPPVSSTSPRGSPRAAILERLPKAGGRPRAVRARSAPDLSIAPVAVRSHDPPGAEAPPRLLLPGLLPARTSGSRPEVVLDGPDPHPAIPPRRSALRPRESPRGASRAPDPPGLRGRIPEACRRPCRRTPLVARGRPAARPGTCGGRPRRRVAERRGGSSGRSKADAKRTRRAAFARSGGSRARRPPRPVPSPPRARPRGAGSPRRR